MGEGEYVSVLGWKLRRGARVRVTLRIYRSAVSEEGEVEGATPALLVLRRSDGRRVAVRISEIMIIEEV